MRIRSFIPSRIRVRHLPQFVFIEGHLSSYSLSKTGHAIGHRCSYYKYRTTDTAEFSRIHIRGLSVREGLAEPVQLAVELCVVCYLVEVELTHFEERGHGEE